MRKYLIRAIQLFLLLCTFIFIPMVLLWGVWGIVSFWIWLETLANTYGMFGTISFVCTLIGTILFLGFVTSDQFKFDDDP